MSFDSLGLAPALLRALSDYGYTKPTPIQAAAIPPALEGQDLLAAAQTGTGKTAAFALPLLQKLSTSGQTMTRRPRALILTPTRELAAQIHDNIRSYAKYMQVSSTTIFGGVSMGPQINTLRRGVDIVIATPGRLMDHMQQRTLDLSAVETLVLDEADRMLDMGFRDDIEDIVDHTPKSRQTLLFSATFPDNITQLSQSLQNSPISIKVESTHETSSINQQLLVCDNGHKTRTLIQAIGHFDIEQAVVFCNTKQSVNDVTHALRDHGYLALALHGDLEQRDRDEIYARFKNNSAHFLVATDVAARGLDVDDLPAVINYDLPRDPEVYVHRIGRTGRAGKSGLALALAGQKETYRVAAIESQLESNIPQFDVSVLKPNTRTISKPPMLTLCLAAGRRDKIRPGDILGALTSKGGIDGKEVGKIDVLNTLTYVAVTRKAADTALNHLQHNKIKNKIVKVRKV